MSEYRFSILMANYNRVPYIKTAIKSVIAQTFKDWELVFVDDASTDSSIGIVKRILQRNPNYNIKLLRRSRNGGYGKALRTAAKHAKGEILVVVDSDDAIAEDALMVVDKAYCDHPDVGMVYTQYTICDKQLKRKKAGDCGPLPEGMSWLRVIKETPKPRPRVSHLKTFKRKAYEKTSGFTKLRRTVDKDIVLKLEEVAKLLFINKELYMYRKHPKAISRNYSGNQKLFIKQAGNRR